MAIKKLTELLDNNHIKYTVIQHSPAYTAQEIAALAHIPGQKLAKTVIIKIDGKLAMVVLPAPEHVKLSALSKATGGKTIELATEDEFVDKFPECETGAMPPFGNLFSMDVYVDERLTHDKTIAFNNGNHHELMEIAYKDFEKLVKPNVVDFSKV